MMNGKVNVITIFCDVNYADKTAFFPISAVNFVCKGYFKPLMFRHIDFFQGFKDAVFKNGGYCLRHILITSGCSIANLFEIYHIRGFLSKSTHRPSAFKTKKRED